MMNKIIDLLKLKSFNVSELLLFNYKNLNITDSEFIVLIYLLNFDNTCFDLKKMSLDLKRDSKELLGLLNSLSEKDILKIEVEDDDESIIFDGLYQKLSFLLIDEKKESSFNIYDLFEKEFGRTLSPMEFEIINAWKDSSFSEELIVLALKEATYNGVSNLRYIDKILHDWSKKGIKSKNDIEKDRQNFNRRKEKSFEVVDYDWLNENE